MKLSYVQKIIKEKVEGVWVAAHDEHGHHYKNTKTGKVVDSVTTQNILAKEHLIPWASGIAVKYFIDKFYDVYDPKNTEQTEHMIKESKLAYTGIRDDAGLIGTQIHDVIEEYFNQWIADNKKPESITAFLDGAMDARVWAGVRSIDKLLEKEGNIIPVATELLVGSEKVDSAGTLDFLLLQDGKLWIFDWKSSNGKNDTYAIQVAAYKGFFEEMTGLKIDGLAIILLSKDYDKVTLYEVPFMNRAYSVFKHQNAIYKWMKNGEKKLVEKKKRLKI